MTKPLSLEDSYIPEPNTGCWLWLGPVSHKGYGRKSLRMDGRRHNVAAHRWIYEMLVSKIADGFQIDHLCRNRLCVNPEHLEQVTGRENVRRGDLTKLTAHDVEQIRSRGVSRIGKPGRPTAGSETYRNIATDFGVSSARVCQIMKRQAWCVS